MSEIRAATISNLAGTGPATLTSQVANKAYAAATDTVFLTSYNLASFTDNGTGNYTHTHTNTMASQDEPTTSTHYGTGSIINVVFSLSANYTVRTYTDAGSLIDTTHVAMRTGDLA